MAEFYHRWRERGMRVDRGDFQVPPHVYNSVCVTVREIKRFQTDCLGGGSAAAEGDRGHLTARLHRAGRCHQRRATGALLAAGGKGKRRP